MESKKLTPQETATFLKQSGLQMAKGQEAISASLVIMAMQVQEKLRTERITAVIMDLEERYGTKSCFNSMSKLQVLAQKPSPKSRVWVVEGIYDWILRGLLLNGDVSKSALVGDRNSCGLVSLFELKQACLEHWLHTVLPKHSFPEEDRKAIREACTDHETWRMKCCGDHVSWQGHLAASSLEALHFIEAPGSMSLTETRITHVAYMHRHGHGQGHGKRTQTPDSLHPRAPGFGVWQAVRQQYEASGSDAQECRGSVGA